MSSLDGGGDGDADALRRVADELQAQLVAHRVEVREALADHLTRSAERERAIASALDSLTGQLNQFTASLAAEVRRAGDATVAQAVAELGTAARLLEGASVDAVAEAVARVDARVAQLATTVGPALRELAAPRPDDGLLEEVRRLRVTVESMSGAGAGGDALAHVVSELHELRGAVDGLVAAADRERANLPAALERALGALDALDTLALRPDPAPALQHLTELVERLAGQVPSTSPAAGGGLTRGELDAALAELQRSLLDAPAPASPDDVLAIGEELAAIRATLGSLAERGSGAAAPEAPLPPLDDLRGMLADRLGALDSVRAGVDQLVAWPAATGEEVDRLAARLGDLESLAASLADLRRRDDTGGYAPPPDLDTLRRQLDAIGRLVHHAVRALHLIEAATVGVTPRTEADRAEAAAALEDLRAASEGSASAEG